MLKQKRDTVDERSFKIELPMRALISKKEYKALNINVYRNLHHYSLATQKKSFHATVKPLLQNIPKLKKISLHYQIFPKTKRRLDIMNVGSIVDKYFSDSLVEEKIIQDDDYNHLSNVSFSFGGIDKNKEYIIVTIKEINSKKEDEKDMRVLLDQNEILDALNAFVELQGIKGSEGVTLSVNADGEIVAEVNIKTSSSPSKAESKTTAKACKAKETVKKSTPKTDNNKNNTKELEDVTDNTASGSDRDNSGGAESTEKKTGSDIFSGTEKTSKASKKDSKSESIFDKTDEEPPKNTKKDKEKPSKKPVKKASIFDAD